ncbi:hypothetical protein [Acinetobacter baumannii]|uniref:hypothetical protein n=1 Tax=Acinetobacter baumannii TaxID=470 RepID=UPI00112DE914|nr:hypothetical protein [Acinetobacter baumannii]EHU2109373.1 hypothetical protein [Acinetobacter baumannii]EHZ6771466.1 hypothetical protein [Acinetobacter baumannii]EKU3398089.1 hypothetical protein [Acinetobacter baumannii]EKU8077582.1 hypothetical protein [Acinetobacter baumannii]EKW7263430.1 hypothetical protein [Acinetobacter baumannii]
MTDLNKERELYESVIEKTQDLKMVHLVGISFNEEKNQYEVPGEKWASELTDACLELNTGWFIWQECVKAKAQAVPETHLLIPKEPNRKTIMAMACVCLGSVGSGPEFLTLKEAKDVYSALVEKESGAEG